MTLRRVGQWSRLSPWALWSRHSPACGAKEVCPALLVGAALLGGEAEVVGDSAPVIAARQGDELKIGNTLVKTSPVWRNSSSIFLSVPRTLSERLARQRMFNVHTYNMGSTFCFLIVGIWKRRQSILSVSHVNYVFIASEFLRGQMLKNAILGQIPGTWVTWASVRRVERENARYAETGLVTLTAAGGWVFIAVGSLATFCCMLGVDIISEWV